MNSSVSRIEVGNDYSKHKTNTRARDKTKSDPVAKTGVTIVAPLIQVQNRGKSRCALSSLRWVDGEAFPC